MVTEHTMYNKPLHVDIFQNVACCALTCTKMVITNIKYQISQYEMLSHFNNHMLLN